MSNDYEQYELKCEKIRESNGKLLDDFATWLQQSGLSRKTIHKHTENIDFYINAFLLI